MPIHVLSDEVASQIAAGEVVERPASVVKELVENALDAGADNIAVMISETGKKRIEVADNGSGIRADELKLAVTRHATSKLQTAADLFRVETLGFRGEALASIGSVSHLTISSRFRESDLGSEVEVENGELKKQRSLGRSIGTTVVVENLFYNVPARKKFLKSDRTERRYIDQLISQYALVNPDVRFQLGYEGEVRFQTTGNGETREVLAAVYGVETARKMLLVMGEPGKIQVSGYVSPPGLTRSNRREITFFVNSRPVQDAALHKALSQAYHTMLMKGRYPLAVLFLQLPSSFVDVNVHPTKAEVRFEDRGLVFRAVERAVRRSLMAHTPVPELGVSSTARLWQGAAPDHGSFQRSVRPGWGEVSPSGESEDPGGFVDKDQSIPDALKTPILRLIGQVAATYLVAEGPDGLYLIDQHAAHERILFEKMLQSRDQIPVSQSLLEPVVVQFSPAAADLVLEHLELLNDLGYQLETFGPQQIKVRSVPALLDQISPEQALRAAVEDLEVDETPLEKAVEEKIIARVCKRAAVKAGQILSGEEQKNLLQDLENCQSPRTCPHGRPTMIHLSVDLLERKFGRLGSR